MAEDYLGEVTPGLVIFGSGDELIAGMDPALLRPQSGLKLGLSDDVEEAVSAAADDLKTVIFKVKEWDPNDHPRGPKGLFIDTPDKIKAKHASHGAVLVGKSGKVFQVAEKKSKGSIVHPVDLDTGVVDDSKTTVLKETEVAVVHPGIATGQYVDIRKMPAGTYGIGPDGKRFVILKDEHRIKMAYVDDDGNKIGTPFFKYGGEWEYLVTPKKVKPKVDSALVQAWNSYRRPLVADELLDRMMEVLRGRKDRDERIKHIENRIAEIWREANPKTWPEARALWINLRDSEDWPGGSMDLPNEYKVGIEMRMEEKFAELKKDALPVRPNSFKHLMAERLFFDETENLGMELSIADIEDNLDFMHGDSMDKREWEKAYLEHWSQMEQMRREQDGKPLVIEDQFDDDPEWQQYHSDRIAASSYISKMWSEAFNQWNESWTDYLNALYRVEVEQKDAPDPETAMKLAAAKQYHEKYNGEQLLDAMEKMPRVTPKDIEFLVGSADFVDITGIDAQKVREAAQEAGEEALIKKNIEDLIDQHVGEMPDAYAIPYYRAAYDRVMSKHTTDWTPGYEGVDFFEIVGDIVPATGEFRREDKEHAQGWIANFVDPDYSREPEHQHDIYDEIWDELQAELDVARRDARQHWVQTKRDGFLLQPPEPAEILDPILEKHLGAKTARDVIEHYGYPGGEADPMHYINYNVLNVVSNEEFTRRFEGKQHEFVSDVEGALADIAFQQKLYKAWEARRAPGMDPESRFMNQLPEPPKPYAPGVGKDTMVVIDFPVEPKFYPEIAKETNISLVFAVQRIPVDDPGADGEVIGWGREIEDAARLAKLQAAEHEGIRFRQVSTHSIPVEPDSYYINHNGQLINTHRIEVDPAGDSLVPVITRMHSGAVQETATVKVPSERYEWAKLSKEEYDALREAIPAVPVDNGERLRAAQG